MANYPFLSSLYGMDLDKIAYVALEVLGPGDSFVSSTVKDKIKMLSTNHLRFLISSNVCYNDSLR